MKKVLRSFLTLNHAVRMLVKIFWMVGSHFTVKKISREKEIKHRLRGSFVRRKKRYDFKNWHKKILWSIRKWVGWCWSQRLHTLFFFVFTTDCCKWVEHVTTKTKRGKQAVSFNRENKKGSCLTLPEKSQGDGLLKNIQVFYLLEKLSGS